MNGYLSFSLGGGNGSKCPTAVIPFAGGLSAMGHER
jgi:hypothetical protein